MTELNLQERFELGVGAYDLSGMPDLALRKGSVVQWGSDSEANKGFGIVLAINEVTQQAEVKPLVPNRAGLLVDGGQRKTKKDLDVLSPTNKKLAPDVLSKWPNTARPTGPADASADLTSADLTSADLSRRWRELSGEDLHRQPQEETGGRVGVSDDELFEVWKRTSKMSGFEFAEARRELEARHADLAQESTEELSDDALYEWGQEVLDGTDAKRRAMKNVAEAAAEREDFWRRAYERGEPVPRDLQEEIGG